MEALVRDLLEFVASRERTYEEVLEAWHVSGLRLPVWEDANERGLVTTERVNGRTFVRITEAGRALLDERRRIRQ